MDETTLDKEMKELLDKAHTVEDKLHSYVTGCTGPEIDALREELIDITFRLDEIKDKIGQKIEVDY